MNLNDTQQILVVGLGAVIWFALVVPFYALSLDLRNALKNKKNEKLLAQYCEVFFEVNCVVWGAISGVFVGSLVSTVSFGFVFGGGAIGMVLIGAISSAILHAKAGESTFETPGKVILFLIAGTVSFWVGATTMHWLINPDALPSIVEMSGVFQWVGFFASLISIIAFFWEHMPFVKKKP